MHLHLVVEYLFIVYAEIECVGRWSDFFLLFQKIFYVQITKSPLLHSICWHISTEVNFTNQLT